MAQGTTKGVPIDIDPLLANNSDLLVPSQKAVKTYTDNGLSNKVSKAGDTMSGSLILSGDPTVAYQAATKSYVDTLINGIDWKQSVNAATVTILPTYAVTGLGQILTRTTNGAIPSATTDNITLIVNQRVLVKNETSTLTPNNGIYIVTQVGSGSLPFILTRASDVNTPALLAEATVSVGTGSTLANTQWHCNPAAVPAIIGTTYITFAQIGTGTYTFSSPLVNNSGVISIPLSTASVNGYLSSADWTNFNTAYTNRITSLTTTGTSGAATLIGSILNIPQYSGGGGGGTRNETTFTATAGQATFTVNYTINQVDVYYNGSKLAPVEFTATSGTSITLATPCQIGDIIDVIAYIATASVSAITFNSQSGTVTATAVDGIIVYEFTALGSLILPNAVSNIAIFMVKNMHSSNITVTFTGGQNADGSTSIILVPYQSLQFISNNTNYNIY